MPQHHHRLHLHRYPRRRPAIAVIATAVAALCVGAVAPAVAAVPSGTAQNASQCTWKSSGQTSFSTAPAGDVPTGAVSADTEAVRKAMREAIAGLPDADTATAAHVRLGGEDGRWQTTSGVTDIRTQRDPKGDERFRAGSVTKAFTAAAVLQLVHERKIDLDGTVQHYLPGLLPAAYPDVKVRHLLNYTSGLPSADDDQSDFPEQLKGRYTTWDHRTMVQRGFHKPMEFTPGACQHYSNIGYNVLGLLIEKVTGHSYEKEIRDRVINRAGLKDTYSPGNDPRIHGRHLRGYQQDKGTLVDVTDWNQSVTWASGDLVTTAPDLERFTTALFNGRIVPRPELELMFTVPKVPVYGDDTAEAKYSSGLSTDRLPDGTVVWGKTGGRFGYLSGFAATRNLSRTIVYSVASTHAKGPEKKMDPTVVKIITAFAAKADDKADDKAEAVERRK
ncbi:serine hydrolase domain-containing protein [Streptomyces triculaminicus]|uniref:serine hydrolase domain-containing protein n=1 Tax=Streptomyces triculaminicus TaxID=2816232 RepID=UPI0033F6FC0B